MFDDDRYWSVDVTYAKASPTEVLMRIVVENHGPDEATLHVLPTLWFRNTWSWHGGAPRPRIEGDGPALVVTEGRLAGYRLDAAPGPDGSAARGALLRERVERAARLRLGGDDAVSEGRDQRPRRLRRGHRQPRALRHEGRAPLRRDRAGRRQGGAAAAAAPAAEQEDRRATWAGAAFDEVVAAREADADEFYEALAPEDTDAERMRILRQACAGLVWSKQIYPYNVRRWLDGDPGEPPPPAARRHGRNNDWRHLDSFDVLAMPDPWEYPWFAAWDLGFHCVPWAHLDPAFAKYQLVVLLREWFLHPNGALPAYEWNFDDVNPPVHVMAALRVFLIDGAPRPRVPRAGLPEAAPQLHLVAQPRGRRRQQRLRRRLPRARQHQPDRPLAPARGLTLEQADGTAWMAYYALSMLVIAVELAEENDVYATWSSSSSSSSC